MNKDEKASLWFERIKEFRTNWGYKHGWGTSNLISSLYFANDELQNIKFVNNPFLLFDSQNVILDLSFFDRRYPK